MRTEIHAMAKAAGAFWAQLRGNGEDETKGGIGLALGGGFARGVAHIGVLRVLEREHIRVRFVAGVSAGAIVAAGLAGGASADELERVARSMKFKDLAGWRVSLLGLVGSERMEGFLRRAFPAHRFEDMKIPLAVVATDLQTGSPVVFHGKGRYFARCGQAVRIRGFSVRWSTKGGGWWTAESAWRFRRGAARFGREAGGVGGVAIVPGDGRAGEHVRGGEPLLPDHAAADGAVLAVSK